MHLFIKIILTIVFFVIASYYLYFFISPSVTVINGSASLITQASVSLPNSNLNFGSIEHKKTNTIYYSLAQNDGSYHYLFEIDGEIITGNCGYLTSNEFNKRFVITVSKSKLIDCS